MRSSSNCRFKRGLTCARTSFFSLLTLALMGFCPGAYAYNGPTHRDITVFAFELMTLANSPEFQRAAAEDPEFRAFLSILPQAARNLEALPANLPAATREDCLDLKVLARFNSMRPRPPGPFDGPMGSYDYPVDVQYLTAERNCGVDPYWYPGTLWRNAYPTKIMHAGNVLGFWSIRPDDLKHDIAMGVKVTNTGGLSVVKQIIETAGGAAAGTVYVPLKCLGCCAGAVFKADFDQCEACVKAAIAAGQGAAQDGIASIDDLIPVFGAWTNTDVLAGMPHHIDIKPDRELAPGWPMSLKPHFDDASGLYGLTAGPYYVPQPFEQTIIALSDYAGATLNFSESDALHRYQVTAGQDFHEDSKARTAKDFEYIAWPHVALTPLDNLGWYGWSEFQKSVLAARSVPNSKIQTHFLGWALHAIGDATVPMHVTSTFGNGHRPYEDAVADLGVSLTGGRADERFEMEHALSVLRAAQRYRKFIVDWRTAHPDRGLDIPLRDLVTLLAKETYAAAQRDMSVYDDSLSVMYATKAGEGPATLAYEGHASFMQARVDQATAATVAFLASVGETAP